MKPMGLETALGKMRKRKDYFPLANILTENTENQKPKKIKTNQPKRKKRKIKANLKINGKKTTNVFIGSRSPVTETLLKPKIYRDSEM